MVGEGVDAQASAADAVDTDEILRYARALIAAPSENPGGTEDEAVEVSKGILAALGAESRVVRSEEGRPSVVARVGSAKGPGSSGTGISTRCRRATWRSGRATRSAARSSTDGSSAAARAT